MYQTGTVVSPTALKTVIESFCTSNGWTLSGSDYLSKGLSHIKLTVPAGPSTTTLEITGANSSDGVTTPAGFSYATYIDAASWPVTYYLFLNTSPDLIVCVLHYDTNSIQPIIFGDIVKIHTNAFVGGNFFFAPRLAVTASQSSNLQYISDTLFQTSVNGGLTQAGACIPFVFGTGTVSPKNGFHAEIDGTIWDTASTKVAATQETIMALYRSPNTWNNQAQLVPIQLRFTALDSFTSYLGYVEHFRFIRIDNYEIGDIVTLGPDKWKVFPCIRKYTTSRNGAVSTTPPQSGTVGFAVRYDGP